MKLSRRGIAIGATLALVFAVVTSWAVAQGGEIHACVDRKGMIRIADSPDDCGSKEEPLTWNVTGPPGPQGPPGEAHHYANVIVVAKDGGDFASIQSALDSITDAAVDNPYLVWIAPGVYEETMAMKPHVHVQGAGQDVTIISSDVSSSDWPPALGTLMLADHVSLRDLTVGSSGSGSYKVAVFAPAGTAETLVSDVTAKVQASGVHHYAIFLTGSGTDVTLQDVAALSEGGRESNYGLLNRDGAGVVLQDGSFTGRGGTQAYGIYNSNDGTVLDAQNITALGEDGQDSRGLWGRSGAVTTLRGGTFTARGDASAQGITNSGGARLEAQGIVAVAENGTSANHALRNLSDSTAYLSISGVTGGISNLGALTCFQVYDGDYAAYTYP